MAWARLDDGFHDHPKVDGLSLAAVGLYTLCLTWAHRHRRTAIVPGHITEARVRKLAGKQSAPLADELLMAGLWEAEQGIGGWVIHDFADYLPKERDPDERREAGRKGAAKRWERDSKHPSGSMGTDSSRASAPAFPTRTRPDSDSSLSGERPETSPQTNATQPPEKRSRCTRHPNGNPTDEPCEGCRADREHDEREASRAADLASRRAERARLDCTRCDGNWITNDDGTPSRRKCDHASPSPSSVVSPQEDQDQQKQATA